LDERTLAESMARTLAERPRTGEGIWIFAYGSLLWKRNFEVAEQRSGIGRGFVRRYCIWDDRDRGTPERPGLTLALEPARDGDGACGGAALRIAEGEFDTALRAIWRQEMGPGWYRAVWLDVECPNASSGAVRAVSFAADHSHPLYVDAPLSEAETAAVIAGACGANGACAEYLLDTVEDLRRRGLRDMELERLQSAVAAVLLRRTADRDRLLG
jgi:cation transport protein ChaC